MNIKEQIKDLIYREQQTFSNEIYDIEELTEEQCELLEKYNEEFCEKLQLLIDEI